MERADEWSTGSGGGGGGSTEEVGYRSDDGWNGEWDDEIEYLSSFGFNGGHGHSDGDSDGYHHGHSGLVGGGAMASLSERDAARLEEVGIMVKELEVGSSGDSVVGAAAAAVMGPPSSTLSPDATDGGGGAEDEPGMATRVGYVAGAPIDNARLRMSCGDPVFFGQLAELIDGVHQESGGRKFLTHAEEMELGVKVQRYRQLIEVRGLMCWGEGAGKYRMRYPRDKVFLFIHLECCAVLTLLGLANF